MVFRAFSMSPAFRYASAKQIEVLGLIGMPLDLSDEFVHVELLRAPRGSVVERLSR